MALGPSKITRAQIDQYLRLYPAVVAKAYDNKIKKVAKREEAKSRDQWRYEELPKDLKGGKSMSLSQLERLVDWKITHGQSRPFLPAMIRKNKDSDVMSVTRAAADMLDLSATKSHQGSLETTMSALTLVCKLHGVGPATGTLILSIYDPDNIPFFQDETHAWCVGGHMKLKYDKKEFGMLFERIHELRKRLGNETSMVELEKVAFVLQHADLVDEAARKDLQDENEAGADDAGSGNDDPEESKDDQSGAEEPAEVATETSSAAQTKRKRTTTAEKPQPKRKRTRK